MVATRANLRCGSSLPALPCASKRGSETHLTTPMQRREVLSRLAKGMGLAVAGVLAVPATIVALSPVFQRRRRDVWRPLGPIERFPPGTTQRALVELPPRDWAQTLGVQAVYVRHTEAGIVVFSRKCTDLGCPVVWDPGSDWFFCPCHGGIFDHEGNPQAGPPPRPLYRFAHRVQNGVLEIDLASIPPSA
jgi:menaquinol-cytochrome c reductase iron-sulfur subunit